MMICDKLSRKELVFSKKYVMSEVEMRFDRCRWRTIFVANGSSLNSAKFMYARNAELRTTYASQLKRYPVMLSHKVKVFYPVSWPLGRYVQLKLEPPTKYNV